MTAYSDGLWCYASWSSPSPHCRSPSCVDCFTARLTWPKNVHDVTCRIKIVTDCGFPQIIIFGTCANNCATAEWIMVTYNHVRSDSTVYTCIICDDPCDQLCQPWHTLSLSKFDRQLVITPPPLCWPIRCNTPSLKTREPCARRDLLHPAFSWTASLTRIYTENIDGHVVPL